MIANADSLTVFDGNGNKTLVQTESLDGCVVVFDSGNRPLEICRLVPATSSTGSSASTSTSNTTEITVDNNRAQDRQAARRIYRRMDRRDD